MTSSTTSTILISALALALVASCSAMDDLMQEPWRENPLIADNDTLIRDLRRVRRLVRDNGCTTNICINIQGDDTLSKADFRTQLDFTQVLTRLVRNSGMVGYAAVQYALTTTPISPLTYNQPQFSANVSNTRRAATEPTNIAAALGYCGFELRDKTAGPGFVIWIGTDAPSVGFAPKIVARQINEDGNRIVALAVGPYQSYADVNEMVGKDGLVLRARNFVSIASLIEPIARKVCDLDS